MTEKHSPPTNLPDGWEYQAETHSVVCGGCLFRFGAEHPDGDGKWTCPNCGPVNGLPEAIAALADALDVLKTISEAVPTTQLEHELVSLAAEFVSNASVEIPEPPPELLGTGKAGADDEIVAALEEIARVGSKITDPRNTYGIQMANIAAAALTKLKG